MAKKMTSHERFKRMFEHKQADRVPILDYAWSSTLERWRREGLPKNADWCEFFDLDLVPQITVDNSPRYPEKMIEETNEYKIHTSKWGVTMKNWKHAGGTPEFLDFTVVDPESWAQAKARMKPAKDRIDWNYLKENYPKWREKGAWIKGEFWFGFDVTHSWTVGTERLLMALVEQPEWCMDMFKTYLELDIAMFEMAWKAGYTFDCISWPDDLGYKQNQFMSVKMYRELVKPFHKRAADWAHSKGAKVHLHSCGDVNPLVPEFIDLGIDALNPLEVKAGMDPVAIKKKFGDSLVLHGGINAVLWDNTEAIEAEMRRTIPAVKENGGYIFASDHSIPTSVSFENFKRIITLAKELGKY
ncbi:MAG: hypothetical protein HZA50_17595 [Planctomycetes bacterium]|nr:hypothetical protein [Planctomycetota bacterium]